MKVARNGERYVTPARAAAKETKSQVAPQAPVSLARRVEEYFFTPPPPGPPGLNSLVPHLYAWVHGDRNCAR